MFVPVSNFTFDVSLKSLFRQAGLLPLYKNSNGRIRKLWMTHGHEAFVARIHLYTGNHAIDVALGRFVRVQCCSPALWRNVTRRTASLNKRLHLRCVRNLVANHYFFRRMAKLKNGDRCHQTKQDNLFHEELF